MDITELETALRGGKLPQSAIVTGGTAEEREAAGRLIAQAAVCSGDKPLCSKCRDCRKALGGIHPDISFWQKEQDARDFTVEKVRTARAAAFVIPNEASRSVLIFRDANTMNEMAQNALLKVLEEPPEHAVLLLLAEDTERFLPTVRSRCTLVRLTARDEGELEKVSETAEKLCGAYFVDDRRALLEICVSLEKWSRQELTDLALSIRRQAVRRASSVAPERFERLADTMEEVEGLLAANVSAGHVAGLLLAGLAASGNRTAGNAEIVWE